MVLYFTLHHIMITYPKLKHELTSTMHYPDDFDEQKGLQVVTNSKDVGINYTDEIFERINAHAYMWDLSTFIKLSPNCETQCQKCMDYLRQTNFEDFIRVPNRTNIKRDYVIDIDKFFD